jgi:hypothetical protein
MLASTLPPCPPKKYSTSWASSASPGAWGSVNSATRIDDPGLPCCQL